MTLHPLITSLAPEIVLVTGAIVVLMTGLWSRPSFSRDPQGSASATNAQTGGLAFLIALATIALAMWLTVTLKDRPPDPVLSLRIDALTWYARWIGLGVGLVILLVNLHVPVPGERHEFIALLLFSLAGLLLAASADDIILLFLALELVSVPTYVLVGLSRPTPAAQEAAGKYFFLGAFAAALMLYGFSFLYGAAGTTTLLGPFIDSSRAVLSPTIAADTATIAAAGVAEPLAVIGLLLVLGGLFFKIAAVPFHFYAPDVYQGAASPVAGLLGFVPKFAGFIGLVRVLSLTGWSLDGPMFWLLWIVAALTMTVGNTLALMQNDARRMLAYSSIAHSGYMLVALLAGPGIDELGAAPTRNGVAAMLFYMAVYGLMNLGAFAALAYIRQPQTGEPAGELEDLAGASQRHPWAALALAVCVFGLMGFPLTAGFLGKVYVFSAAFAAADTSPHPTAMVWIVVIGVINSAIAAAYYLRIVATCYMRPSAGPAVATPCGALRAGLAVCAATMVALFLFPGLVTREAAKVDNGVVNAAHRESTAAIPPSTVKHAARAAR